MAAPVVRWCGRERCALEACGQAFKMQAVDHPERALYNKRPQWAVPEEFIFMQPAFAQCAPLPSCTCSRGWCSPPVGHLLSRVMSSEVAEMYIG